MRKGFQRGNNQAKLVQSYWGLLQQGRLDDVLLLIKGAAGKDRATDNELLKIEATALQQKGKFEEAFLAISRLEERGVVDGHVMSVKGVVLRGLGRPSESVDVLRASTERYPDHAESWHNLAILHSDLGEWEKAKPIAEKALGLLGGHPLAIRSLGRICINLHDGEGAQKLFQKLLDLGEDGAETWQGIGAANLIENRWLEAAESIERAIKLDPRLPSSYANLAIAKKNLGDWNEAKNLLRHANELDPENVEHRWNLALCLLGLGEFSEGWTLYESRFDPRRVVKDKVTKPNINAPMLQFGDEIRGKTVLVAAEQGFGDSIQFCRYARELKALGAKVVLMMPEALEPLLQTLPWADLIHTRWNTQGAVDYWTFPMSLPHILSVHDHDMEACTPYLYPTRQRVEKWQPRLETSTKKLKVGLVWAGRSSHTNDRNRSMALSDLAPLFEVEGVQFYSLQKEQDKESSAQYTGKVEAVGLAIEDFGDTAAIISQLDLLISVDSAPVHLAGALGRQAWALIPFTPDFRWQLSGESTHWYRSVTLYRQSEPRDWASVVQRVREDLVGLVAKSSGKRDLNTAVVLPSLETVKGTAGINAVLQVAIKLHVAGDPQARDCYLWVLQFEPKNLDARRNLAAWYRSAGQTDKAKTIYEETITLSGTDAVFLANYSNLLLEISDIGKAREIASRALNIDPENAAANYVVAACYTREKEYQRAKPYLEKALRLKPGSSESLSLLGLHLLKSKEYQKALDCFTEILKNHPNYADAYVGLAHVLLETGYIEQSLEMQTRAISIRPNNPDSHLNKAAALSWLGRYHEAAESAKECLKLTPENPEANFYLGMFQLALGDFEAGMNGYQWRNHPARLKQLGIVLPAFSMPQWQGESLHGKTIVIFPEQGFGDYIQFVRYAKQLKELGANVWSAVKEPLHMLMKSCPYIDRLLQEGEKAVGYDYWVFALSLPYLLKTKLETIPCPIPYLYSDPELTERWLKRLASIRQPSQKIVGLIWSGSADHSGDRWRSIAPEKLMPLLEVTGITFVALDKGNPKAQKIRFGDREIINIGPEIQSFADTAAVLKSIDLLITVDSAPAHLAGAMGLPVWTLVAFTHDWRWLVDRTDSPWYPTMRLFRQSKRNDWTHPLEEILLALKKLSGENLPHTKPTL